ncbi:MAG: hypothetical protein QXK87_06975 [Fervidicoccaceae archaeon]
MPLRCVVCGAEVKPIGDVVKCSCGQVYRVERISYQAVTIKLEAADFALASIPAIFAGFGIWLPAEQIAYALFGAKPTAEAVKKLRSYGMFAAVSAYIGGLIALAITKASVT